MVGMTRKWIIRQLTLGEFDSHRHVWRKAIWMAGKISVLAYGLNLAAHWLMYQFDLLPYTARSRTDRRHAADANHRLLDVSRRLSGAWLCHL